jgi:hypothetical protein
VLLENYYLPADLERQFSTFVDHYQNHRYHEGFGKQLPADVYYGQGANILKMREKVKKQTSMNAAYRTDPLPPKLNTKQDLRLR